MKSIMNSVTRHSPILALLLFVGMIAISFSAIFIKWSEAPVSVIAMYRLALTNLMLLPFLLKAIGRLRGLTFQEWHLLFWGGLTLGLHFLFWMESLRWTSVASSTALTAMEPIFVMIGSFLVFRQRTTTKAIVSMCIAIIGALMISMGDFGLSGSALKGDLYSVIGTVAVAVHMLIGQELRKRVDALTYSFFVFFFASALLAIYNVICKYPLIDYPPREWGIFLLLAIVPTLFGHYLFNWLLKYVKATMVSMCVLAEPVGASLLAWVFFGEIVSLLQIFACILLLSGVGAFIRHHLHPDISRNE